MSQILLMFMTETGVLFQDGFLRVILDGGPSRVFSPGDAKLLEEDLEVLKVFVTLLSVNWTRMWKCIVDFLNQKVDF